MFYPICAIIHYNQCLLCQTQQGKFYKDPTYIGHMLPIYLQHHSFCTDMLSSVKPVFSPTIPQVVLFLNSPISIQVYSFFCLDYPKVKMKLPSPRSLIWMLCLLMIYFFSDSQLPLTISYLIYVSEVLILLDPTKFFKNMYGML